MVGFFDVSRAVLAEVVFTWIALADVGRLDSAVCSKEWREKWISLIRTKGQAINLKKQLNNDKLGRFISWCVERQVTQIQSASLQDFPSIPVQKVERFLISISQCLEKVIFSVTGKDGSSSLLLPMVGRYCTGLLKAEVSNCTNQETLVLFMNDASKTLHSLKLKKCAINILASISGMHFPCLHRLDILGGAAAGVSTIIRASPALRVLGLSNVSSSIDSTLQALSEQHAQLIALFLIGCESFSAHVLMAALASLTHLENAHFESLRENVTDASMTTLATSCTQLTKLALSNCLRLTDASMEAVATHCQRLHTFVLSRCGTITLFGAQRVIIGCKNLTHVSLNDEKQPQPLSPGWGVVPLAAALSACGRVTHLTLQGLDCNSAVWRALSENGCNLQCLRLVKQREMKDLEGLVEVARCTTQLTTLVVDKDETRLYPVATAFWKAMRPGLTVFSDGEFASTVRLCFGDYSIVVMQALDGCKRLRTLCLPYSYKIMLVSWNAEAIDFLQCKAKDFVTVWNKQGSKSNIET